MFCSGCGRKLNDGDRFCTDCGKPVNAETARPAVVSSPKAPKTEIRIESGIDKFCPICENKLSEAFERCQVCGFPVIHGTPVARAKKLQQIVAYKEQYLASQNKKFVPTGHTPLYEPDGSVKETGKLPYFVELIRANFPEYSIKTDISCTEAFGVTKGRTENISILLSKDGSARLAILLVPKAHFKKARVFRACAENGVKAVRFMQEYDNYPDYVVERIRQYL